MYASDDEQRRSIPEVERQHRLHRASERTRMQRLPVQAGEIGVRHHVADEIGHSGGVNDRRQSLARLARRLDWTGGAARGLDEHGRAAQPPVEGRLPYRQ